MPGARGKRLRLLLDDQGNDLLSLKRLCLGSVQHLSVSGAGVSVVTDAGDRDMVYATDHVSAQIEDLQISLGEGPCVDAWTRREAVMEPDLASVSSDRWPGFGPAARAAGAGAVFSLPLQVGQARVGAMDIYRASPGDLSGDDLTDAMRLGDAVTQMLLRIEAVPPDPATGATGAPWFSAEVYQASGMIMVQLDVDIAEALARMRAHAYSEDRPVRDVARDIVARRLRLERDH